MAQKQTKTKSSEDSVSIVEINGLDIKTNSLYKIENKLDKSAPDGFQKANTTKLPSEGISNSVACRYISQGNNSGQFDTGLYTQSPCYAGKTDLERKAIVTSLNKHLVEPFESIKGVDILKQTNTAFWDEFTVELFEGRVFNTANPVDLLDLYIAVQGFELCPANLEGDPRFKSAEYVIKDSAVSMSVEQRRAEERSDATYLFGDLLRKEREVLLTALKYLGIIRSNQNPLDSELKTAFSLWLDKDVQHPKQFNNTYEKIRTDEGLEEIEVHLNVKRFIELGRIKKEGSEYIYKGEPLGMDIRSIVRNLVETAELVELKDEIRIG